jgi:hypothetical protein
MSIQAIIYTAIGLVVAAIILTTITWEIDVQETRYIQEPYTYEEELIREKQVINWPWFWQKATEVQYSVKNTDTDEGTFILNFLFDNGSDSDMETKKVKLMPGEGDVVKVKSPLSAVSKVSIDVTPPFRSVPQLVTVKKKVNGWYYFPFLRPLFK